MLLGITRKIIHWKKFWCNNGFRKFDMTVSYEIIVETIYLIFMKYNLLFVHHSMLFVFLFNDQQYIIVNFSLFDQ